MTDYRMSSEKIMPQDGMMAFEALFYIPIRQGFPCCSKIKETRIPNVVPCTDQR